MSKAKILSNLKGRVSFVGDHCAISGLDIIDGLNALKELVEEGKVEKQMMPQGQDKDGRPHLFPMYRAIATLDIEGNTRKHLKIIK